MKRYPLLLLFCAAVLALVVVGGGGPAHAQFFDDNPDQDELFVEDDDRFFEDTGDGFGEPGPGGFEQDFTEGDRFVDESLVPQNGRGVTTGGRQFQLTLGRDRDELPLNIAWGAGTGLLIGGWFALINEGDNRETQRSIGIGIVSGILLGVAVGTRSVFDPDAPRPARVGSVRPRADAPPRFEPLVSLQGPDRGKVGFRMTF